MPSCRQVELLSLLMRSVARLGATGEGYADAFAMPRLPFHLLGARQEWMEFAILGELRAIPR